MTVDPTRIAEIRIRFDALKAALDERRLRLFAAAEATALGRGGIAAVTEATGIRGKRIRAGMKELQEMEAHPPSEPPREQRIRRPGAGRKLVTQKDPSLLRDLESLVEPTERGDPESPLRWTTKSLRQLGAALKKMGHSVSPGKISELLYGLGYSLQATRKRLEGTQHADRDAQFREINRRTREMQRAEQPVISVDTKKKELVGQFSNGGVEWQPSGEPTDVRVHDFRDDATGKAVPYGIYDIGRNEGFVNVGMSGDTGAFAVNSINAWWRAMGRRAYPGANELMIVADAGGSNSPRGKLWRSELQKFANETGLAIHVSHMPPGTSKWNKIEHRLFSHITMNWRGKPLVDYVTIVSLIAATTTSTGLKVKARLDRRKYEKGIKVPNARIKSLEIYPHTFHGDWNYTVLRQEEAF